MNLLKSIYIAVYVCFAVGGSAWGLHRLRTQGLDWAWVGFLVTVLPMTLYLARAYAFRNTARTRARMPAYTAVTVGGVAVAAYAVAMLGADSLALILAGIGALAFTIYNLWYSKLGRAASSKIAEGQVLADFELGTPEGGSLRLSELGDKQLLIMFYRGNWCPLCMAQIKEVARRYQAIAKRGVEILLVSPQPESYTGRLAKQFDVPMHFLSDRGNAMAKALELDHDFGTPAGLQAIGFDSETVLPTVIITDKQRRVIWRHETDNYRVRPEPETFLKVLDGASV